MSIFTSTDNIFKTFKGAFTENFFVQQFRAHRKEALYCWQGKVSEVDFIFNNELKLHAVEIKSGESGKLKSLNIFKEKYTSQSF